MIKICRRQTLLWALFAVLAFCTTPSFAKSIVDSAGRHVGIPDRITRVFAAAPPAATVLYVLAPRKMLGWVHAPSAAAKSFLLPFTRSLPELGGLTDRGDALNIEKLVAAKADLIVDVATVNDVYRSLADRVQAQTGIPYLLIDGRLLNTPNSLRLLARALGEEERGETLAAAAEETLSSVEQIVSRVPADQHRHVYLARSPAGLQSGSRGSLNGEIIELAGAINVVARSDATDGLVSVSPEQVSSWAPDTIVTLDRSFQRAALAAPEWRSVPAVSKGRVLLAPALPFGFIDAPPSVNRPIGLTWLTQAMYPDVAQGCFREQVRRFYYLFYQVDLTDPDLDDLLGGR